MSTELHVWATRPAAQNTAWQVSLMAEGWSVKSCSLLDIRTVKDETGIGLIKSRVLDLYLYQSVFFVSQNAVSAFFEVCEQYWPQIPMGVRFYGVGRKTQQAITSALAVVDGSVDGSVGNLVEQDVLTFDHDSAMTSASLLAHPVTQKVSEHRILICRGRGGLPLLGETLASRGARVDYCELYDRCAPSTVHKQIKDLLGVAGVHIIPVFSGESLSLLANVLDSAEFESSKFKQRVILIAPSTRVADEASTMAFGQVDIAENATEPCMLAAIANAIDTYQSKPF